MAEDKRENQGLSQVAFISAAVSAVVAVLVVLVFLATGVFSDVSNNEQTASSRAALSAQATDSTVVGVVESASPSVVSIIVSKDVPVVERYFREGPFGFRLPQQRQEGTQRRQIGSGSGFFVSEDGLIVTNRHVVSDEDASYSAVTSEGETYNLEVIGRDPFLDVAILKTQGGGDFPALEFGNSDNLQPGETVIAIGNALGELRNSVSVGVVSGLSRSIVAGGLTGEGERLSQVIQTDAAINFGNSGGPLLGLSGQVMGVNVAIAQGSDNISFALPANLVKEVVDSVEEFGEIVRPFLGVQYLPITQEVAEARGLPVDRGALVVSSGSSPAVVPGSAAAEAGIQNGDILLSFDGQQITADDELGIIIRNHQVGDTVSVTLLRGGEERQLEVELDRVPDQIQQ